MQGDKAKLVSFYARLRKQYEDSSPITYEVDLISAQPKTRAGKFGIIIKKFISIFMWGMRETYQNEDDRKDNYWTELSKQFHQDYEMGFVNETYYDKPKNKIKKYFALLIYSKRIFIVLEKIVVTMGYLYKNDEEKKNNYKQEIAYLDFMADGKYTVMGEIITDYDNYAQMRSQKEKIEEMQRLEEEKKRLENEKKDREREELQKKEKEKKQKQAREEQEKKREVEENIRKKREQQSNSRLINSDYFPENYVGTWNSPSVPKKIEHSSSRKKLELPNHKQQHGKLKNSEKLFIQRFKDELECFVYALKPETNPDDKMTCFTCNQNLKEGIYFLGGNQNYCYYTGKWYCNKDMSDERMSIPWKAIQSFDLSGYPVCKTAYGELKVYYEKPIVEVKKTNPIIKQNHRLNQFLVIKRQIHLIYDSICNLDLIEPLMKKRENYCLKINLFSMKNLYDIYHGQETPRLQRDYEILSKHFFRCEICQKKKGYICPICKDPVKIFPFELKETFGCSGCRKLYHRKCVPSGKCGCNDED